MKAQRGNYLGVYSRIQKKIPKRIDRRGEKDSDWFETPHLGGRQSRRVTWGGQTNGQKHEAELEVACDPEKILVSTSQNLKLRLGERHFPSMRRRTGPGFFLNPGGSAEPTTEGGVTDLRKTPERNLGSEV